MSSLTLLSPARRYKLALLLREQALVARSRLAIRGDSTMRVPSASSHTWTWHHSIDVPIPAIVYQRTHNYSDDVFTPAEGGGGGRVSTSYAYEVAVFDDATVYSNGATHVSVHAANGSLLAPFSTTKYLSRQPARRRLRIARRVPGRTANLFGNVENLAGNYGHWLVDGLSRQLLIDRFVDRRSIDHVLVPHMRYDFQREAVEALGFAPECIIEIDPLECLQFEQLVCTSPPRGNSSAICPDWMIEGFRKHYDVVFGLKRPERIADGKRLYVSRRDAAGRRFGNEDEVESLLGRHGFESVALSEHDLAGKFHLFAAAGIVIGLTGAGFANLMLSPRGLRLVEMQPSSYVNYLYTTIAGYLNSDYRPFFVENGGPASRLRRYAGQFDVDLDALEASLDGLE